MRTIMKRMTMLSGIVFALAIGTVSSAADRELAPDASYSVALPFAEQGAPVANVRRGCPTCGIWCC